LLLATKLSISGWKKYYGGKYNKIRESNDGIAFVTIEDIKE